MSKIIYNFAKVFTKKQSFKDLNVRDTGLKRGFLYSNFCKILNKSGDCNDKGKIVCLVYSNNEKMNTEYKEIQSDMPTICLTNKTNK
jgi:hypothetical protein